MTSFFGFCLCDDKHYTRKMEVIAFLFKDAVYPLKYKGFYKKSSARFDTTFYTKGATIYNQRDKCKTMDVVLSGSLVSYSLSENGSATTMFEFKQNNVLGANLLFQKKAIYPLNIYCLEDCRLLHIKKTAVENFLHDYN